MPERLVVIAVHGVGDPAPGLLIDALAANRDGNPFDTWERDDLILERDSFPRAAATDGSDVIELLEVNWSDLARPLKGPLGTLRHLMWLMMAMLQAEPGNPHDKPAQTPFRRVYGWYFQGVFFWCIWPIVATLLVSVGRTSLVKILLALALGVGVSVLAWFLGRYSPAMRWGVVWGLGAAAAGCSTVLHGAPDPTVTWAARIYMFGQAGALCILPFTIGELLLVRVFRTPSRHFPAMLAFVYGPAVLASILGSLLWLGALWLVGAHRPDAWDQAFLTGLSYNLPLVERLTTLAILAVTIVPLLGICAYSLQRWVRSSASLRSGAVAQNALSATLVLAPLILGVLAAALVYGFVDKAYEAQLMVLLARVSLWKAPADILSVYEESALRVVPYLLMALGPAGVLMNVLGDVAFFIVPRTSRLSILNQGVERLVAALAYAGRDGASIVILAHSQGSIIAVEALRQRSTACTLVTLGSPVQSLYGRFLGYTPPAGSRPWHWLNAFRRDDYVGGPIADATEKNGVLGGPGGHTDYWSEKGIWQLVTDGRQPSVSSSVLTFGAGDKS